MQIIVADFDWNIKILNYNFCCFQKEMVASYEQKQSKRILAAC